ncbi:MAG: alpha/beta hydrolase [Cyanobacteria bacterium J06635_15]
MAHPSEALWLSVSPCLKRFDQRLLLQLARKSEIRCWDYAQTADEPCCLAIAVTILHDYLKQRDRPVHLLGHGISGLVGLRYAQQYPQRVRSLTLISVGANPAVNWHAHYYALRQLLPCRREMILGQMARLLFGVQSMAAMTALIQLLKQDLDSQLTLHSLVNHTVLTCGGIEPPLFVCHGAHDVVIDSNTQVQWRDWLKPHDRLWHCPEGKHFFHYDYPKRVAQVIHDYWQSLPASNNRYSTLAL